jgi:ABC-type branched-subunit amino acid transport system substrate-binding protein
VYADPSDTYQGGAAADLMVNINHSPFSAISTKYAQTHLLVTALLLFTQIPSDTYQGGAAADLMVNTNHKNIALVYEDTPYGYGLGFAFIAAFTSRE